MRTSLTTVHCCDPTGRSGYHISPSFLWSRGYRIAPDPIKACCENKKLCFCLDLKFVCDGEVRTMSTIESQGRIEREGIDLWPISRCGYRLLAHQLVLTVMVCSRWSCACHPLLRHRVRIRCRGVGQGVVVDTRGCINCTGIVVSWGMIKRQVTQACFCGRSSGPARAHQCARCRVELRKNPEEPILHQI